jgi:hypothetical protein
MVVLTVFSGLGVAFACGFAAGFVHGYDQSDKDSATIKAEMTDLWKEVEQHGPRNHPIVRFSSTKSV